MTDKELKAAFVAKLKSMPIPSWLDDVDGRLRQYIEWVRDNSEGENDLNNVDIVAACCKFLRMCNVYDFDKKHVLRYIKMAESLKIDSLDGKRCYPLTAPQVFIVAGMHGFIKNVSITLYDKEVKEKRKVVQDAIIFCARKMGKTQIDAWEAIDDFLFGDNDAECHIVSNSLDQSKIAYRAIVDMLKQLDPDGNQIRFTQTEITWRDGRRAAIYPHTAGAKSKDGAKASKVMGDEAGSSAYIKDRSEFYNAFEVYISSMGTRKNPFSIKTTTAGKVISGPFEQELHAAQEMLYRELDAEIDKPLDSDYHFLYSCHPDEWEKNDECFGHPNVWRKCNPHISVCVQPTFYEQQWKKAQGDQEVYKEVVTKLFNQFVSDSSRPWIQAEQIRRLQIPKTVRDLGKEWYCWVGCDFSKGDDMNIMAYNCYNPRTKQYFFDVDAWVASEQMHANPNAVLYEQWAEQGWLHVCHGNIIDETDVLRKLDEVSQHVKIVSIGYDPFDSLRYVNLFQTWLVGKLSTRMSAKKVEEALKRTLQPVSQTWASFNASCQTMWDLVNWPSQRVFVSANPIIPYSFGCCVLEEDKMGNVKPVKRVQVSSKIDTVIGLLMGCIMQSKLKL